MMTTAAALAFFVLEVGRAAAVYGIAAPDVVPIYLADRHPGAVSTVYAYVPPTPPGFEPEVYVMWHFLDGGNEKLLRCVARHEVAHIALGHGRGANTKGEQERFEAEANAELAWRWGEPENCGV